MLKNVYF